VGVRARALAALLGGWARGVAGAARASAPGVANAIEAPSPARHITRLTVREGDHIRFVACAELDWIEADGNYVVLHAGPREHRVRLALRALLDGLDPARFVRIHRSVIVNVERIREVQPWFGGDYIAILHTGAKLRVSRTRAAALLRPFA
jgi:two-component system LytT family response regulator